MENAVPLAASLGTEQASAVWSLTPAQANLACRGLRRISLMKYIYDLLQTCIVPHCCVLSGQLLLMSSRFGRARRHSADWGWGVGASTKNRGSLTASDCNHKQSVINAGEKHILAETTMNQLIYNRLNVTSITWLKPVLSLPTSFPASFN